MKHVPIQKPTLWTWKAMLKGNLVPILVGIPFFAYGIHLAKVNEKLLGADLYFLFLGVLAPAFSLNWLAMVGNQTLKSTIYAKYSRSFGLEPGTQHWFCGAAFPEFSSLVDPHQDIGYLIFKVDSLTFFGEQFRVEIPWKTITQVKWKSNPHSILGLGGFVSVQWKVDGETDCLYLESRDGPTLLANKRFTREFLKLIEDNRLSSKHNCQATSPVDPPAQDPA